MKFMEGKSFYEQLMERDIIARLKELLMRQGYFISAETGKITFIPSVQWDTPWVFINRSQTRNCHLHHRIGFKYFDYVPSRCMDCWKVVIRPKTVADLFKLYEALVLMGHPSKCGLEFRNYVTGNYGGYIYCDSEEEGQQRKEDIMRSLAAVGCNAPVILKRYCTEFEAKLGPSDRYEPTPEDLAWEKRIEESFDIPKAKIVQPEMVKVFVMRQWIRFAHSIGDESYLELTGGEALAPSLVNY